MIDPATPEKIAYRLKHAAGMYQDNCDWNAATQCMNYADILLDYIRFLPDYNSQSIDHNPMSDEDWLTTDENGIPVVQDDENTTESGGFSEHEDYEPVYATLHFYKNKPDSMRQFRLCNQAEDTRFALSEYDNKLRAFAKYGVENTIYAEQEPEEVIRMVRELFHSYLNDYGIDLTED